MKRLSIVFGYEFLNVIKKKSYIMTTLIMSFLLFALTFVPIIVSKFIGDDSTKEDQIKYGMVYMDTNIDKTELSLYPPFDKIKEFNTREELNSQVNNEDIEAGIILINANSLEFIVKDQSIMTNQLKDFFDGLKLFNRNEELRKENIDVDAVNKAENIMINHEITVLGKSSIQNLPMAYIGMFLMYILTISYGSIIASSVAKEKSNRTMELLITSCDPKSLIVGKVLASITTIFIQVTALALGIGLGIVINQDSFPSELLGAIKTSVNVESVTALIVFGTLGYIMYAFIFAALGALVSKMEDVSASVMPISLIFVLSYIIASVGIGIPDNIVFKIASFVPLTAPLCMFVRNTLTSVSVLEIIISAVLVLITTIGLAGVSIKIYRMGTLNYGNKIGLFKAIKMVFSKNR